MTIESDNTDKLKILLADAKAFGIDFQPPCVNRSELKFVPLGKKLISYGLGAIKGTGAGAIEVIERARREGGPFKSLFDFCARMDRRTVNKRVVEALVKAGAFDALHAERERVLASVGLAFQHAEQLEANASQGGLFDFADAPASEPELVQAPAWGVREKLSLEKVAIGFYLSGHLFDEHEAEVRRLVPKQLNELEDSREPLMIAGIVGDLRVINGARGRVAIFKLDDGSGSLEVAASGELYDELRELLAEDNLVLLQSQVRFDRFSGGLRGKALQGMDLAGARARFAKALQVDLPRPSEAQIAAFKAWVQRHPPQRLEAEEGTVSRGLSARWPLKLAGVQADLDLGEASRHWPSDVALKELAQLGLPAQLLYR
jgi:DNA polymerase-3 subunit alpha